MNRTEFLKTLQESMEGEMPASEIAGNVQYYKDYIDSQSAQKGEQRVLEELGDPRLIARTLIDTYKLTNDPPAGSSGFGTGQGSAAGYDSAENFGGYYNTGDGGRNTAGDPFHIHGRIHRMPRWAGYLILALFILLVIVVITVLGRMAFWLLRLAFPFLLFLLLIQLVFGGRRR